MISVCLISPGHLTSNPRLVKEADTLAEAGQHVVIIHGWSFPAHVAEEQRFQARPWAEQRRVPFGALASPRKRLWQRCRQRLAKALVRMRLNGPAMVIRAWHPAGPDLVKAAREVRADLYIAHYPAALPAAALAAQAHGGRYAFDAEDFHLGDWPEEGSYDFQRSLLRLIEARYLPGCEFITAASPGIAKAYSNAYSIKSPVVLRNVFPLAHAPAGPAPRGTIEPGPSLYWFSQTIGPDRGLECAVRAIALTRSRPHLYLRGFISTQYRQQLQDLARVEGVEQCLHLLPPAAPERMEKLAAAYDIGLVAETGKTPNRRIALTNKLFTYALAGIPAVISDIPAHLEFARDAGEAVMVYPADNHEKLAEVLDLILDNNAQLAARRTSAYQLGQKELNWDREKQKLLGILEDMFAK